MRRIIYAALFLFLVFSVGSCKKKKTDPTPTPTPTTPVDNGIFSATVSGAAFTPSSSKVVHTKSSFGTSNLYSFYFESKNTTTNKMMDFFLYSTTEFTPGTYTITLSNSGQAYFFENKDLSNEKIWQAPKPASSDLTHIYGTVVITEITTTRAKGNFNYTTYSYTGLTGADSTRVITNATFDVPLTRQGF
ncbi:MAG: hypothetical protein WC044_11945 [Crocinitomicaceae bacterium]